MIKASPEIDLNLIVGDATVAAEANLIDMNEAANSMPNLPDNVVKERANRYKQFASDVLGISEEDLDFRIRNGSEDSLRADITHAARMRGIQRKNRIMLDMAKQRGAPITPEEYDAITRHEDQLDPLYTPEKEYAKYYMKFLESSPELQRAAAQATPEEKKQAERIQAIEQNYIARTTFLRKHKEDADAAYDKQSWGGWLVDQAKGAIPGHDDYYYRGVVPGTDFFGGPIGRGQNLREQRRALMRLPDAEFYATVDKVMKDYGATNPTLARDWITAMVGLSSEEENLHNLGMTLDAVTFPGVGAAAKGATKATARGVSTGFAQMMGKASKDMTTSAVVHGSSPAAAKAAAGDVMGSAVEQAADQVARGLKGVEYTTSYDTLNKMPSFSRVDQQKLKADPPARLAQHIVDDVTDMVVRGPEALVDTLSKKIEIERTPILQAAREVVEEGIAREMIKKFRPISEQIYDVSAPKLDKATGVLSVDLKFGASDGHLFASEKLAKQFIREYGLGEGKVVQQGGRWYVTVPQNIDETAPWVKRLQSEVKAVNDIDSWANSIFGKWRNPDDILDKGQIMDRKLAVVGGNNMILAAKEIAKAFKDLRKGVVSRDADGFVEDRLPRIGGPLTRKERMEQFKSALVTMRKRQDRRYPEDPTKLGDRFETIAEMDNFWMNNFKRLPDPVEIKAYYAHQTIVEMDRIVRDILLLRKKNRQGVERHIIRLVSPDTVAVSAYEIEGTKLHKLPDVADVLVMIGKGQEDTQATIMSTMSKEERAVINRQLMEGKKVLIRQWDYENNPFTDIRALSDRRRIPYLLVDKVESKALQPGKQVNRRFGGHYEYEYNQWIKQADFVREKIGPATMDIYLGDNPLMPVGIRAMGNDIVKIMNDIRLALKDGNELLAETIYNKTPATHLEWNTVKNWFIGQTGPNGVKQAPRFSLHEPFELVEAGQRILDKNPNAMSKRYEVAGKTDPDTGLPYSTFRDGTKGQHASPSRNMEDKFTRERDGGEVYTITNSGTRQEPAYKYEPAKFVDPLQTMDRAYSKVVNSAYMDDYKIKSVETWLEQAVKSGALNATERQIRMSPFHFYHNADLNYTKGADPAVIRNLKIAKAQIDSLIGVNSEKDNMLFSISQRLADYVYDKTNKFALDPVWLLPKLKDPARALRGFAFHMSLGVFAVPQFMVQLQTYGAIAGIAGPGLAMQGAAGAAFSRWAMFNANPKVLKAMDTKMSKLGWKPGEWMESHDALSRTGFLHVGREAAMRDSHMMPQLFRSGYQTILDWGTVFFTEGERASRMGAWHAAYKEFRKKQPHGRLTDQDIKTILARADDLSVNMTRASSSQLHQGWLSVPTQFLSYQMRLAELMIGKRLGGTTTERMKARGMMLATMSALYGLPTIPGVFGIPVVDDIKKIAADNGYISGANGLTTTLMEGIPAAFLQMATGQLYGVQDRYAPKGFETLRELTLAEKSWWEILGGPAASRVAGVLSAADPFIKHITTMFRGEGQHIKANSGHVLDILKEISSVNSVWRTVAAIQTGRYLSKNENYLADVSPTSAVFMFFTGLAPQSIQDDQLKNWSLRDKKQLEEHVSKEFVKEFRRGLTRAVEDPEQAQKYFDRAYALMHVYIPLEDRAKLQAKAFEGYEKLTNRINQQYYLQRLRPGTHDAKMRTYQTIIEKGLQ
jgi:hypothetical protein